MPAPTLSTLSDEAYDDYISQRLTRLERRTEMISRLATEELNRGTSDPYYDYVTTPRSHSRRPRRTTSTINSDGYHATPHGRSNSALRRPPSSDNTRLHQERRTTRHPGYVHPEEEGHYYYEDSGTSQHQRQRERRGGGRLRSASVGAYSTEYMGSRERVIDYDADEEDDDYENVDENVDENEEDRKMREREIITKINTIHNQVIPVQVTDMPFDQDGILQSERMMHNVLPVQPGLSTQQQQHQVPLPQSRKSDWPPQPPQLPPGQQQPAEQLHHQLPVQPQPAVGATEECQTTSVGTTPILSSSTTTSPSTGTASPVKKKKWPWRLFNISAAAIVGTNKEDTRHLLPALIATKSTPIQDSGVQIWPVATTGPRGDTLSPAQREEIVRQLPVKNLIATAQKGDVNDFTKVADLSHIWVFRAENMVSEHSSGANMWFAFDYQNQNILTQHCYPHSVMPKFQPENDGGVEIFDSHIRNGLLPVFVFPFRQEAFYATSLTAEHIVKLQVSWLPKTKDVVFVYRLPQH